MEKAVFKDCKPERKECELIIILCTEMLRELHGDDETFDKAKVKKCVEKFFG